MFFVNVSFRISHPRVAKMRANGQGGCAIKAGRFWVEFIIDSLIIGIGATALMDLWAVALHRFAGQPAPSWGMGGRWFAHVARGHVWHDDIGQAAAIPNESAIGWVGHYAVGVVYAAALLAIWGMGWAHNPTLAPALIVGLVTISAGWFFMGPGMGGGIAAARADQPWRTRGMGLLAHGVFGLGLYLTAWLTHGL